MAGTRSSLALALAALLASIPLAGTTLSTPAWAVSGKERLAGDLVLMTTQQVQETKIVPAHDQKRTAQCLAKAIVADIPEPDAAKLADIFDGRVPKDPALQKKWFTISAKEAPARNTQVLQAVDKLCPDIGPYAKQML